MAELVCFEVHPHDVAATGDILMSDPVSLSAFNVMGGSRGSDTTFFRAPGNCKYWVLCRQGRERPVPVGTHSSFSLGVDVRFGRPRHTAAKSRSGLGSCRFSQVKRARPVRLATCHPFLSGGC